jgi:hypothetical protein
MTGATVTDGFGSTFTIAAVDGDTVTVIENDTPVTYPGDVFGLELAA